MINNVETLRALCFTEEDLQNIANLGDSFSAKEIEFMVEFKKTFELGIPQLKKFIDKLDTEGSVLDTYTIQYYVDNLKNGPLCKQVEEYAKGKKYFKLSPDSMGNMGNLTKCPQNTPSAGTASYPLGCSVDTFNKLPPFIQATLTNGMMQTENVYRGCLKSSLEIDNTLPIVNKNPSTRYSLEVQGNGGWESTSNGCYMVQDCSFYKTLEATSIPIMKSVETYLGTDDYRMFTDKKEYNPFDYELNQSVSINTKVNRTITDGEATKTVTLDLMGDVFDSDARRESEIIIPRDGRDYILKLNSNRGQLGN